jgi:hypothetical protein
VNTQQPDKPINKSKPADQPRGVIQSLTSGFDLVTRHPDLMLLPILLDAFLWLGPRLSAYPIIRGLLDFMNSPDMLAAMGADQVQQMQQMQKFFEQVGQAFNLFWWLTPTLLGVPSLMIGAPSDKVPTGQPVIWPVSSGLVYVALFLVLSVVGLGLSAAYWGMLASRVREQVLSLGRVIRLWWGLIKFAVFLIVVVLIIGVPTLTMVAVTALLSPVIGQFIVLMAGSLILWLLFYLVFTIHGLALLDAPLIQSALTSIRLMRFQFIPAMGLIVLVIAIYVGLGLLWNIPDSGSWVRVAGILGHAFTATGLLASTALFYLDRTKPVASE